MDLDSPPHQDPVTPSYVQKLKNNSILPLVSSSSRHSVSDLTDEITPAVSNTNFIPISAADKSRLYNPWQQSVIIKVMGRKIGHQILGENFMKFGRFQNSLLLWIWVMNFSWSNLTMSKISGMPFMMVLDLCKGISSQFKNGNQNL